jgi:ABC-type transport system involved in multi-copper enzyme maturation permease subunit
VNPAHFLALFQAEVTKLFSRSSARFGLGFAIVIGIGVPLARALLRVAEVHFAHQIALDDPGHPAPVLSDIDPAWISYATLYIRNFFLMRIVLIMMGALTFAGEFQARTLREDLLRPVPRAAVLLAKWLSLVTWIAATLVITFACSAAIGLIAWGPHGDWGQVALGYLATVSADAGFAALVLCVAVLIRGVAGTMVGMFLFYFFDFATGVGLMAFANFPFGNVPDWAKDMASKASPWLPSAAFGVWQGAGDTTPWSWEGFVSLALITLVSLVVAERVFARIDVP